MIQEDLLLAFLGCLAFGVSAARVAKRNGRSPWLWLLIGTGVPFFGLSLLLWLCGRQPNHSVAGR